MATRPAWTIKDGVVRKEDFSFEWSGGFALTPKQYFMIISMYAPLLKITDLIWHFRNINGSRI